MSEWFPAQYRLGALRPADAEGEEELRQIKHGEVVLVKFKRVRRPRNLLHHRKYFALLNLVFQNQDFYPTLTKMRKALAVAVGHCETFVLKNGAVMYEAKSIAFDPMDQNEFEPFWDHCCDVVLRDFLPGVTREELENEILELVGAHPNHGQFGAGA